MSGVNCTRNAVTPSRAEMRDYERFEGPAPGGDDPKAAPGA
jgi:hypothetical protein